MKPEGLLGRALFGLVYGDLACMLGLRAHEFHGGKDYQEADHKDREPEYPQELSPWLNKPPYEGPHGGYQDSPYHDERQVE